MDWKWRKGPDTISKEDLFAWYMKLRYISSIHVERKMFFSISLTLNHKYLYTHVSIGHQLRFATNFASPTNYNKTENLSKWIEDYTEFLVQLEK